MGIVFKTNQPTNQRIVKLQEIPIAHGRSTVRRFASVDQNQEAGSKLAAKPGQSGEDSARFHRAGDLVGSPVG